jgi:transposase-like protein
MAAQKYLKKRLVADWQITWVCPRCKAWNVEKTLPRSRKTKCTSCRKEAVLANYREKTINLERETARHSRVHQREMSLLGCARATARNRETIPKATNRFQRWNIRDEEEVLTSKLSDVDLALKLGRTARAVGMKRHNLK